MSQMIEDVFHGQSRALNDWLSHHHIRIARNPREKLLVVHQETLCEVTRHE